MTSRWDTINAVTIEARAIGYDLAGRAEPAARARPAAVNVCLRSVLLLVETLRVSAFVIRAGYTTCTIARLSAGLTFVTHWALGAAAIDVRFGIVELVVRA